MTLRLRMAVLVAASLVSAGCGERTEEAMPPAPPEMVGGSETQAAPTRGDGASAPVQSASTAPGAEIPLLDEGGFAKFLADHRGKVVFLDCWATWCGACKTDFPHTVALHKKFADQGLVVAAVAFDEDSPETRAAIAKFLGETGATFPCFLNAYGNGFDEDSRAYTFLGVDNSVLPHYQLYDREGRLLRKFASGDSTSHSATPEEIEAEVAKALAAKAGP